MKLNRNSITSQLYRWFYATYKMPQTLCPYFWKLVIMWILIVPYSILALPYVIVSWKKGDRIGDSFLEKPGSGAFMWLGLGLVSVMIFSISIFWVSFPKDSFQQGMQILGIMLWAVTILISLWQGAKWLKEKWEMSKIKYDEDGYRIWPEPKEKKPSIIVEFVKAKYNKYCPKIDWE